MNRNDGGRCDNSFFFCFPLPSSSSSSSSSSSPSSSGASPSQTTGAVTTTPSPAAPAASAAIEPDDVGEEWDEDLVVVTVVLRLDMTPEEFTPREKQKYARVVGVG